MEPAITMTLLPLVISRQKLEEIKASVRLESTLSGHVAECIKLREATNRRFEDLDRKVDEGIRQISIQNDEQHKQNLESLKFQRKLLLTILFAMLGFVAEQAWTHIFGIGLK